MSVAARPPILVSPDVREAVVEGQPVVCLESAVVTHGLPHPVNARSIWRTVRAVRQAGAVCATVGVIDGKVKVGLSDEELHRLGEGTDPAIAKIGVRDLGPAMVRGLTGGTTVSATTWIASRIGVRVVATGGLGGIHRDFGAAHDASSDLTVLSQAPVAVVCAGPKAVLDIPATLEALETLGIPVLGLRTAEVPGFYYNDTGLPVEHALDDELMVARSFRAHRALERKGGVVVLNRVPESAALTRAEVEPVLAKAQAEAVAAGLRGKAITPHLLAAVRQALGERALEVNLAVLESNGAAAARLAHHVAREVPPPEPPREGA